MAEGVEPDVLKSQLHILARAVIKRDNAVLLARAKGQINTFLPGGHLETGESLKTCLVRELQEELGLEASIGRYLGMVEHTWGDGMKAQYELNHLFETSLPTLTSESGTVPLRETHLTFFWAELDKLTEYSLEPYPLQQLLSTVGPHIVWASTLPGKEV